MLIYLLISQFPFLFSPRSTVKRETDSPNHQRKKLRIIIIFSRWKRRKLWEKLGKSAILLTENFAFCNALPSHELLSLTVISTKIKMPPKLQKLIDKVDMVIAPFRRYFSMRHQTPKVQALYDHCNNIFTSSGIPPPSSQALHKLSSILGILFFLLRFRL